MYVLFAILPPKKRNIYLRFFHKTFSITFIAKIVKQSISTENLLRRDELYFLRYLSKIHHL